MAELLSDYPTPDFIDYLLAKHPAPLNPETGLPAWEGRGIRLHGNQGKILKSRARLTQCTGGVRAGKSMVAAMKLHVDMAWRETISKRYDDLYWVIGPTYDLAAEEMRHLSRLLGELEIPHSLKTPSNASWTLTFPHKAATVETKTSGEASRIAARAPRGIVMAEANQQVFEAFSNSRLRTTQTRGWVFVEGTFENETGGQWFRQYAEEWRKEGAMGETYPLPTWDNRVLYPGGREDPEILFNERTNSPIVFLEKFGGEAQRRSDLVMQYAADKVHIAHRYPRLGVSFDPEQPVYLFGDPGFSHAYAVIAAQIWGNIVWCIDAVYRWGKTVEEIVEECSQKPWALNVEQCVFDFAARQQRAEGPPVIEQWTKYWRERTGKHVWIHADPVPLRAGYDIHQRALLNSWPEDEAARLFNHDKRLSRVTDPTGPRLMFAPQAATPLFGGIVDGTVYLGEYNRHRHRKNAAGDTVGQEPIDGDNDAIKAISYGLWWRFGATGLKTTMSGITSIPWEMKVA